MKNNRFQRTVKHYSNQRFQIAVLEDADNMYCVVHENRDGLEIKRTEPISDYKMASYMFDLKLEELQGN